MSLCGVSWEGFQRKVYFKCQHIDKHAVFYSWFYLLVSSICVLVLCAECVIFCWGYWMIAESNSQSADIRPSHQEHLTSCHNNRYWLLAKCHFGSDCGSPPSQSSTHTVLSDVQYSKNSSRDYFSASTGLIVSFRTMDSVYCLAMPSPISQPLTSGQVLMALLYKCLYHCLWLFFSWNVCSIQNVHLHHLKQL